MHSAIIVVEPPRSYQDEIWTTFLTAIWPSKSSQGVEQLADHVWLIDVQKSPAVFARFVDSAERQKLSYRILAIEGAPEWRATGFVPKKD
jgi:hypothetical protein